LLIVTVRPTSPLSSSTQFYQAGILLENAGLLTELVVVVLKKLVVQIL